MQHAEIELKFCVPNVSEFSARAVEAGWLLHTPRTLERNTLFDTPGRDLLGKRQILRMRDYGGLWVLTHKRPPEHDDAGAFYKERVETETHVADGVAASAIFAALGYQPVFRYEKYRTEFHDGAGSLVLDETPIGDFGELEGEPEWIDRALERIGVPRALCFTDSYGRMFLDWKERSGSPAENMTFDEITQLATR